jgi:8-amino-7-oxononanoate synthase
MPLIDRVKKNLREIYLKGRIRTRSNHYDSIRVDLSSNDYLGLATDDRLRAHFVTQVRSGASASRVLCHALASHETLEKELAQCTGMESALVFGSGYLANTGVLSSLISRRDFVVSDKYVHASLLDGIRLSMASHLRAGHNSLEQYEQRLRQIHKKRKPGQEVFIVTESVFSMDGDIAPLSELHMLLTRYDAFLVLDEAHAVGVYGKSGGGMFSESGLSPDRVLVLGTLSKSLASYGGFACGSKEVIEYIVNTSRPFIFSTALPEVVIGTALSALLLCKEHPEWRSELRKKSDLFINRLQAHGLGTGDSSTHIVPIYTGTEARTMHVQAALAQKNIKVSGIRPPTVPEGTSRLRCSVSRAYETKELLSAADTIAEVMSLSHAA